MQQVIQGIPEAHFIGPFIKLIKQLVKLLKTQLGVNAQLYFRGL